MVLTNCPGLSHDQLDEEFIGCAETLQYFDERGRNLLLGLDVNLLLYKLT